MIITDTYLSGFFSKYRQHPEIWRGYDISYYILLTNNQIGISLKAYIAVYLAFLIFWLVGIPLIKSLILLRHKNLKAMQFHSKGLMVLTALIFLSSLPPIVKSIEKNHLQGSLFYNLADILRKSFHAEIEINAIELVKKNDVLKPGNRMNVVIVALESMRAKSIGVYNEHLLAVTPTLVELSQKSLVANKAYTVIPHTSKALTAINCGISPMLKSPVYESYLGVPVPCLPEILGQKGYETIYFQSSTDLYENEKGLISHYGYQQSLTVDAMNKQGMQLVNYFGYEDDILLKPTEKWLSERDRRKPFLAFYLTGITHHPYHLPKGYNHKYFGAPEGSELNNYLNAIHYTDQFIKKLIDEYKSKGLYENTIFVFVGDHGEGFLEHSRLQHNLNMYQETLHIPLIVHSAKLFQTKTNIEKTVSQIDILSTILDLLSIDGHTATEGKSIVRNDTEKPAFAACWFNDWCLARVDKKYKYIYNFDEKEEELYDLDSDPQEKNNIAAERPSLIEKYRAETLKFQSRNLSKYHRFYIEKTPAYSDKLEKTVNKNYNPGNYKQMNIFDFMSFQKHAL